MLKPKCGMHRCSQEQAKAGKFIADICEKQKIYAQTRAKFANAIKAKT
jgi:hypothetical protein